MVRKLLGPTLAMMALAGCNPARSDLRHKADQVAASVFNVNSGNSRSGQRVEPRFCMLNSAIIARPVGDRVVESSLWDVADEQVIKPELRQALEANGLRVGIITGDLPPDVLETFKAKAPQQETQWVHFALPDGDTTPIVINEPVDTVTLLLNHGGKVDGRDYQHSLGRLLITPRQVGTHDIELRVVPQIQHGERRRTIGALDSGDNFAPQEFAIKDAQQEEILRELGSTLLVKPGQTLVVGCRAAQSRSLGTFMFLQAEAKSDRMLESVVLIQTGRNNEGPPPLKPVEDPTGESSAPAEASATLPQMPATLGSTSAEPATTAASAPAP